MTIWLLVWVVSSMLALFALAIVAAEGGVPRVVTLALAGGSGFLFTLCVALLSSSVQWLLWRMGQ